ncbi:hypothetical protein BH23ACT4_BH23ACT4_13740 [soil metagenome]
MTRDGRLSLQLDPAESAFLSDMLRMLESVGQADGDPGEKRLNVPAYLGDAESAEEWRRLMSDRIEGGRAGDRDVLRSVIETDERVTLDPAGAEAILRVVNEARLVLAARLGIEVESDYEQLDPGGTVALHYLGLFIEGLTHELSRML